MKPIFYLFDSLIYEYTKTKYGVEIRRIDGEDIDYSGTLNPNGWDEKTYELILDLKGVESAEEYKEGCDFKTHTIWSKHYEVIENIESHIDNDHVFLVIDYDA